MERQVPYRVLVIDDQRLIRQYLELFLKRAGYEVLVAADGQAGIERLQSDRVDLVLTDLKMPVLDGFAVLRYVRESPSPVPVVLMTAYGSPGVEKEALRLGAFAYLAKPFTLSQLEQTLTRALEVIAHPVTQAGPGREPEPGVQDTPPGPKI